MLDEKSASTGKPEANKLPDEFSDEITWLKRTLRRYLQLEDFFETRKEGTTQAYCWKPRLFPSLSDPMHNELSRPYLRKLNILDLLDEILLVGIFEFVEEFVESFFGRLL